MQAVLSTKDVGDLLGLTGDTIRRYVYESANLPGRRYKTHPFPAPSGRIGRSPYWSKDQIAAIKKWADTRPGSGTNGGRKAGR